METNLISPYQVNRMKPTFQTDTGIVGTSLSKNQAENVRIQNFRHGAMRYDLKITVFTADAYSDYAKITSDGYEMTSSDI